MNIRSIFLGFLLLSFASFGQINTGNPAVPFGSNTSYAYGIMPTNLPTTGAYGRASEIASKYNTWKSDYIENCGTDKARVKFDNTAQTVSEGIAYGMLLAAYAGDKDLLNRLWAYYKQHRNSNGVMHWRIDGCNSVSGQNGATDAELDAAMALIVANYQWPNTTSPHNYKTDAVALINAVKNYEINASDYTFENGDMWKPACRNPSYQAPGYARVFKLFMAENGNANNAFWDNVVQRTENLLINNAHNTSGLSTNWCTPAGPPSSSCSGSGTAPDKFGYDACRAPWRQGVDYIWYGPAAMQTITNRQAAYWIGRGGAGSVQGGDGLNHDGSGSGNHNAAFVGPVGALSLSISNTTANQAFCNALYTENKNDALSQGYFTKILQMIGLFVQTGNFWNPYAVSSSTTTSVTLTAPTVATAAEGDVITVSATATATSGTISKVEFYAGTVLIGSDNTSPYSVSWTANVTGSVSITAVATNTNGDVATSAPFIVSIYKTVNKTSTAPAMDGSEGTVWNASTSASLKNVLEGTIANSSDLSAYYKALWDDNYFYVLVNVTDNTKVNNGGTDIYNDDAVEVFFDIGNDKSATYGANDFQYTFRWNDNTIYEKNSKTTGVTFGRVDNSTGYVMTMRFPWSTLTGVPAVNQLVGFDVAVNDDDNGGARDRKISWTATEDEAWRNPSYMGTVILKGASCTAPSAAGTITGVATTCANATGVTYSIAAVTGATGYTWTVPTGATITNGSNTRSITVTFGTTGGNVTVTPTNTCGSGTASSTTVAVSAAVTPAVAASASTTTICPGTSVTFTATPSNGGTPTYQWRKNTVNISGATGATYATTAIANNDKFDVIMTSTATCRSANTATSTQVTMTVNAAVTPAVTASASTTTICPGTSVTFTATPSNGGTPTYQWRKNTVNISGATGATYATTAIANNDKFDVVMTSTATCRSANTATSTQVTMTVNAAVTPAVTASASTTTICPGTSVTFTATPSNGGIPTYQWRKNAVNISGATGATYATTAIANNDKFDVIMTSTATCRSANTATSTQVTMTVNANVTPSVTATASTTAVCSGSSVTFTAAPTHGGTPAYQWRRNSTNISGATGATYTTSAIANNDKFDVVMTSNANCRTANTATSTQITMTLSSSGTASVSISVAPGSTVYTGQTVTFTATPVNGGSAPTYQWRNGSNAIPGATNATYSSSTLPNGSSISVTMVSNAGCVTTTTVHSSSITITVNPSPSSGGSMTGPASVTPNQTNVTYSVPDQAGMTYVWSVPPGATIVSGQNTNSIVVDFGSSSGVVKVTETNPVGQTFEINKTVTVGTATSVDLPFMETVVSVYPVPCNENVTIDMNMSTNTTVSYTLIDATGNIVDKGFIEYAGTAVQIETTVAAGVYQLILQWDGKTAMNRIVKY
jgi:endo-1,4-beta-D-glucanase Y